MNTLSQLTCSCSKHLNMHKMCQEQCLLNCTNLLIRGDSPHLSERKGGALSAVGWAMSRDLHPGFCLIRNEIQILPPKLMQNSTSLPTDKTSNEILSYITDRAFISVCGYLTALKIRHFHYGSQHTKQF